MRDRFHGLACLAPAAQAVGDDEHFESFYLQQMRHPGARGFARSSAVEINLALLGEVLDFIFERLGSMRMEPVMRSDSAS